MLQESGSNASLPSVAIIIVNYRGREDTLECLASLARLTYPNHTVLLVDQASGDGTPEAVQAVFPAVQVVENPVNDGFAGGNNLALRLSLEQGADYAFLLNNDTTVAPDLLDRLISYTEAHADVGIAGPLMLWYDAPDTVWSAGGAMGPHGESRMIGQDASADTFPAAVCDVDFVVGCGLLARRNVLEQVGLMDERFFLYYEESDLCARVRRAGWRIVTVPEARLWHKVSRSTGTASDQTLYYMRRNVLLYLEQNAAKPRTALRAALLDSLRLMAVWWVKGERRRARVLWHAVNDYRRRKFGKRE